MTSLYFNADDPFGDHGGTGGGTSSNTAASDISTVDEGEAAWRRHRFRLLYEANHDDLWKYCLRRANSTQEAEEALAETFTVAWRRLDIVPTGDDARPWLFGVARNELRTGWRKNKRASQLRDRLVHAHTDHHSPDPADTVVERPTDIFTAMASLREKDQEILRLAAWEELPHVEIAAIIGCSENAVAIRVHRARTRLAKTMAKNEKSALNRSNRDDVRRNVKAQETSTHVGSASPTPQPGKEA